MRGLLVTVGGLMSLAYPAAAQSSGPTGQAMAQNCYVCHGPAGRSAPPSPGLARMPADYPRNKMLEFKSGQLPSTVMGRIAKGYSDEQIGAISDYLASLK